MDVLQGNNKLCIVKDSEYTGLKTLIEHNLNCFQHMHTVIGLFKNVLNAQLQKENQNVITLNGLTPNSYYCLQFLPFWRPSWWPFLDNYLSKMHLKVFIVHYYIILFKNNNKPLLNRFTIMRYTILKS